jgi:hypothetical protein
MTSTELARIIRGREVPAREVMKTDRTGALARPTASEAPAFAPAGADRLVGLELDHLLEVEDHRPV